MIERVMAYIPRKQTRKVSRQKAVGWSYVKVVPGTRRNHEAAVRYGRNGPELLVEVFRVGTWRLEYVSVALVKGALIPEKEGDEDGLCDSARVC